MRAMAHPIAAPATELDLRAVPDDRVAHLVDGQIYSHARPRIAHCATTGGIYRRLANSYSDAELGGPGGWLFLFEPELRLGKDLVVPDIAGWRRERMPRAPDVAQISLAPDWICEVLSNGTEAFDRGPKRRCYVRAGVPHLWCVQPAAKLIEVFRKPGDFYATVAAEVFTESISLEPFTAVPIDLSELVQWADDQPEA
jgi:Uma2 family endonuclease